MSRPGRAKMCSWLSGALLKLTLIPANPADIKRYVELARDGDAKRKDLARISGELGWSADADLDLAWDLIQEYDARWTTT